MDSAKETKCPRCGKVVSKPICYGRLKRIFKIRVLFLSEDGSVVGKCRYCGFEHSIKELQSNKIG